MYMVPKRSGVDIVNLADYCVIDIGVCGCGGGGREGERRWGGMKEEEGSGEWGGMKEWEEEGGG